MAEQRKPYSAEQEMQDWREEITEYRQERDAAVKRTLRNSIIVIIYLVAVCILFISGLLVWSMKYFFIMIGLLAALLYPLVRYLIRYAVVRKRIHELEERRKTTEPH